MRLRTFVSGLCSLGVLLAAVPASASGAVTGSIATSDPLKPVLTITNQTDKACQVADTVFGTLAIAEARQDGQVLSSAALTVAGGDEPFDISLARQLKTLEPGKSIALPLSVTTVEGKHILESVAWSPGAGVFGQQYTVQAGKPLDLRLTYDAPLTNTTGAPLCGPVFASTMSAKADGWVFKTIAAGIGALVLVLALLFLIALVRAKRLKPKQLAALMVLAGLAVVAHTGPHARAAYEVPPSASTQFNNCMTILNAHRDITGPVLDALARHRVEIVPNNRRVNDTARYTSDWYRIYWDPDSTYTYPGGDPPVTSYPCDRLFHEMYHAFDMINGTFSRQPCGSSGIETKEVMATRAQNRLRQALGLPPRTHYGTERLPTGPCTPPPSRAPCTGRGCAQTNGDPHLLTFDHLRYDFQAAGEFVAAHDPARDLEVQVRQEPFEDSRTVSVNTAVAMKVGDDRVELRLRGSTVVLIINGKEQALATTKLKSGGTIVALSGQDTTIAWTDGSAVTVGTVGAYGLRVFVDPAEARAGKLEGLLGNFSGNSKDDLKIRGTSTTIEPKFEQLYPKFADSWRVGERSLFTYDRDTSTETYTDRSLPDEPTDTSKLPNRAAAEALCRELGITDPVVLDNCILDVALTGRPEFARAAVASQDVTTGFGGTTWQLDIPQPGGTASVTFAGTVGQKVFVDVPAATLRDQCGSLILRAPDGKIITSGCIINRRGFVDGTVLPAAGTYTLSVKAADAETGSATLRLITATDQQESITPDGPAKQALLSRPGAVSTLTFEGVAGQRIFVDIPGTTLPNQCGGIGIKNPSGNIINTGCIINNRGFVDAVTLPVSGTYTVFVDPSERAVGQAAIRAVRAQDITKELRIGGPSATTKLEKPGSIAAFTFAATAGQRVQVEVTDATLPNQCGGFTLQAPDGKTIDSDCIINRRGRIKEGGVVLPQSGTYTVIIDPTEANTGSVTLRAQ